MKFCAPPREHKIFGDCPYPPHNLDDIPTLAQEFKSSKRDNSSYKALTGETFTTTTDRLRPVNNVLISFCDKSNRTDASFAFIICSLTEAKGLWPLVIAWRGGERGLRGLWSLLIAWRGGERGLRGLWSLLIAWLGEEKGLRGLWSLLIAWQGEERSLRGLWSLLIAWRGGKRGLRGLWSLLIAWREGKRGLRGLWSLLIA